MNVVPDRIPRDPTPQPKRPTLSFAAPEYSEATQVTTYPRVTLYVLVMLLASAIAWCLVTKVDIVVTADATIATDGQLMVVQPFELSIVRSIDVKVGDVVTAGQTLVTLDPTLVGADTAEAQSKLSAGQATMLRSDAELAGAVYSPDDSRSPSARVQQAVFEERQAEVQARKELTDRKIRDLQIQLDAKRAQEPALRQQYEFLKSAVEVYLKLRQTGDSSVLRQLEAQRAAAEMEGKIADNVGEQRSLEQQIKTAQAEYEDFISKRRRELIEDYVKTMVTTDEAASTIAKANMRRDLVQLRAPGDGVVLSVAQRAIGSVIRPAETIVKLVPRNSKLLAELQVETRDIGRIQIGDPVNLKLETLPYAKHGYLTGKLIVIAPDSVENDEKLQAEVNGTSTPRTGNDNKKPPTYFGAKMSIEKMLLRNLPDGFVLRPGMKATADIKVGERAVLDYILDPLTRALTESFRES